MGFSNYKDSRHCSYSHIRHRAGGGYGTTGTKVDLELGLEVFLTVTVLGINRGFDSWLQLICIAVTDIYGYS